MAEEQKARYFVLKNTDHKAFLESVEKALGDGWVLVGGVSIAVATNSVVSYAQALQKTS